MRCFVVAAFVACSCVAACATPVGGAGGGGYVATGGTGLPAADATSGDTGADTVTGTQASGDCAGRAKALCAKFQSCLQLSLVVVYGDLATCEARAKLECELTQGLPGAAGGWPSVACVSAFSAATCSQVLDGSIKSGACVRPAGTLVDGQACGADAQCKSGGCKKATDAACGVCGQTAGAGDACSDDSSCTGSLQCVAGKCVQRGGPGAACAAAKPCRADLWCKAGTCATPAGPGETCDAADPFGSCALLTSGVYCKAGTCAKLKTSQAGGACDDETICPGNVCQGGTCVSFAKDGDACSDTKPCLKPAECTGGVCKLPNPAACK